ncbi:class I SAM-dependent DNA methyltransferase [Allorhizocola rhizosphaerae]|uniref:class I SAM-dependent DNA methyltransferase n=1 Tax=Allorhizocola rhizosphaerae TaxID=1872709 RepID=UPI000E3E54DE|nr:class I SAM-dependent methyltransferase [Allorhizocola rhizosphaerae]
MTEPSYLRETRAAYDTVAGDYARLLITKPPETSLDLAMVATFAELVKAADVGPVADLGCGPGRMTAHLSSLGLTAFGVDLSPEMVAVARRTYPELPFDEGSMTDLDLGDGAVGGVLAWYSIIHFPTEMLPAVFAEFHRVLSPGGHVLLAFQVGDERLHLEQGYGHAVSLHAYRRPPGLVAELLSEAGMDVRARLLREPEGLEKVPQACVLARKPVPVDHEVGAATHRRTWT